MQTAYKYPLFFILFMIVLYCTKSTIPLLDKSRINLAIITTLLIIIIDRHTEQSDMFADIDKPTQDQVLDDLVRT